MFKENRKHQQPYLISNVNDLPEKRRKVIGCFRSAWGAIAYAALASVIHTASLSGVNAFDAIQSLFSLPALPLPSKV